MECEALQFTNHTTIIQYVTRRVFVHKRGSISFTRIIHENQILWIYDMKLCCHTFLQKLLLDYCNPYIIVLVLFTNLVMYLEFCARARNQELHMQFGCWWFLTTAEWVRERFYGN